MRKLPRLAVTIICLVFLAFGLIGWYRFTQLQLRVVSAQEQAAYFQEIVTKSGSAKTKDDLEGYKLAIVNYYPSGSKQLPGTPLNQVVETARAAAINQIDAAQEKLETAKNNADLSAWLNPDRDEAYNSLLTHNLFILRDLDKGDLDQARKKLEDDAVANLVYLVAFHESSEDPLVLAKYGGVRFAARYWHDKSIPFAADEELRLSLEKALQTVRDEMQRRSNSKEASEPVSP